MALFVNSFYTLVNVNLGYTQTPNDPLLPQQIYLNTVNVPYAWQNTQGNATQKIAIISVGGINSNHEDLNSRVTIKTTGSPTNYVGAANPIAGIIGATTNNSIGIAGINWYAPLLSYDVGKLENKVVKKLSDGTQINVNVMVLNASAVSTDINDAVNSGAKTIIIPINWMEESNINGLTIPSFQIYPDFLILNPLAYVFKNILNVGKAVESQNKFLNDYYAAVNAVKNAYMNEAVVVGKAVEYNGPAIGFPGELSSDQMALAIGASDLTGNNPFQYSSTPNSDGISYSNKDIDVIAPGINVLTTLTDANQYGGFTGTDASAAIATGIISLLQSKNPNLNPDDIRHILHKTAADRGEPGYDNQTGYGLIDAGAAMDYVNSHTFTHGVLTNGQIEKIFSHKSTDLFPSAWRTLSTARYYADIYKITFQVPISRDSLMSHDIWYNAKDTYGWSIANPNDQSRHAEIQYQLNDSLAIFSTYIYKITNLNGQDVGWYPTDLNNIRLGYTIASKEITENTNNIFVNNATITNNRTYSNEDIFIKDGVTLEINSQVTIENGSIYLGKDASLVILSNGRLTADGVTFTSFDPNDISKRYYAVESHSSDNVFTNCTFTGGNYGFLKSEGWSDSTKFCTFTQNNNGIGNYGGSLYILASNIEKNSFAGIWAQGGVTLSDEVHQTDGIAHHSWYRTKITENGVNGIFVGHAGTAYFRHTRVSENGSDEIKVNGGYLYAGQTTNSWDNNRFTDDTNTGYYLNNIAYSSDGETYISHTAWAQQDYWGGGSPPDSKIWGDVRRDYYTTSDQTIYVDSLGTPPLPGQAKITPKSLLTVSTAAQVVSNTTNSFDSEELLEAKQRMNALQEAIAGNPEDRWNIRRVQEWYHLARRYDINNQWGERSAVTLQIENWKDKMGTLLSDIPSAPGTGGSTLNNDIRTVDMVRPNLTQIKTHRLMGETALLLDIEQSIDDGNVTQAISQSHQALPRLQNTDSKAILYGYQLKAWQNMGRYDSAYVALERIKALKPDPGMTSEVSDDEFAPH